MLVKEAFTVESTAKEFYGNEVHYRRRKNCDFIRFATKVNNVVSLGGPAKDLR